jgi:microbial collagenase
MPSASKPKSSSPSLPVGATLVLSLLSASISMNSHAQSKQQQELKAPPSLRAVEQILSRIHVCSDTLSLRSEALSDEQEQAACQQLGQLEKKFHQLFAGNGKTLAPVKHDNNQSLRANIYRNKNTYVEQAGMHFNMPVNNGGMYLEGTPEQIGNHAEFVAYQREQGAVHNLGHEYIHYLDGRFNLYGDFCANLHDSHAAPENCPKPAPQTPYLVWWGEGLAEYIAHGNEHAAALAIAAKKTYRLSELFDTGYEKNNDSARIYSWGYLAVRFMLERHRDEIDRMLAFTRVGDYPRYQALVRSWGTSFDAEFAVWLENVAVK